MPVARRPPWVKISQRGASPGARDPLGVDGDDDALGAELLGRLAHDVPVGDRRRIDRGLIRAREQKLADVFGGADTAADCERHEADLGRAPDHVEQNAAIFVACSDVQETQFVRARSVVGDRALHRIARVAQIDELDALHDAAVLDVETRDDPRLESHCPNPVRGVGRPLAPAERRTANAACASSRPS